MFCIPDIFLLMFNIFKKIPVHVKLICDLFAGFTEYGNIYSGTDTDK